MAHAHHKSSTLPRSPPLLPALAHMQPMIPSTITSLSSTNRTYVTSPLPQASSYCSLPSSYRFPSEVQSPVPSLPPSSYITPHPPTTHLSIRIFSPPRHRSPPNTAHSTQSATNTNRVQPKPNTTKPNLPLPLVAPKTPPTTHNVRHKGQPQDPGRHELRLRHQQGPVHWRCFGGYRQQEAYSPGHPDLRLQPHW